MHEVVGPRVQEYLEEYLKLTIENTAWALTGENGQRLPEIAERAAQKEKLSVLDSVILAQFRALLAFLYTQRFTPKFLFERNGRKYEEVSIPYRTIAAVRLIELLRLQGVIKEQTLNADRLLLGVGSAVADVVPFWLEFTAVDVNQIIRTVVTLNQINPDQRQRTIEELFKSGAITYRPREGATTLVEVNEELCRRFVKGRKDI